MINFDIVFISYDEEEATQNYEDLKSYYPHAKHVKGIKGIREAHNAAAKASTTDFFFTVDGDNRFIKDHVINIPSQLKEDTVYVWRCKNAVNDLVYGYGGLKLWPKIIFNHVLQHYNDHAMSATRHYNIVDDLVTITHFNTSSFSSWRSGFRESVKLSDNIKQQKDNVSQDRLNAWLSKGADRSYGEDCQAGARAGQEYFNINGDKKSYDLINDFDKLKIFYESKKTDDDL